MKRIGAVLFCMLISVSAIAIEIDEAKFNLGESLFLEKKYQPALSEFDSLMARYPASSYLNKTLYMAAKSAFAIQQYEKSEAYYRQLGEKSTSSVDQKQALFGEAECNYHLKHWEKSASLFLDFALKFPESPVASSALYYAAKSSESIGLTADAKGLYQRIVTKYPGSTYYQEALKQTAGNQQLVTNQPVGLANTNFAITNGISSPVFPAIPGSNQMTNMEQFSNFLTTAASNSFEESNKILMDQAVKENQKRQEEVDRYRSLLELKAKLLEMKEQAIRDKNNLIVNTNVLKGMP